MTPALQLLAELESSGVVLFMDDEILEIDGPDDVLTDNVLDDLRRFKPEIIDILQGRGDDAPQVDDQFATWIQRPAISGAMGWEPHDLDEQQRWWNHPSTDGREMVYVPPSKRKFAAAQGEEGGR